MKRNFCYNTHRLMCFTDLFVLRGNFHTGAEALPGDVFTFSGGPFYPASKLELFARVPLSTEIKLAESPAPLAMVHHVMRFGSLIWRRSDLKIPEISFRATKCTCSIGRYIFISLDQHLAYTSAAFLVRRSVRLRPLRASSCIPLTPDDIRCSASVTT